MIPGGLRFPENSGVRTVICQKRRLAILRLFHTTAKFYYKSINVRDYSTLITGFDIRLPNKPKGQLWLWDTAHLYDIGTEPLPKRQFSFFDP